MLGVEELEEVFERFDGHGFGNVEVEAAFVGAAFVFVAVVAGDGDDNEMHLAAALAELGDGFVTVEIGHANIDEGHVGQEGGRFLESVFAAINGADVMSERSDKSSQSVSRVTIVVHDEDSFGHDRPFRCCPGGCSLIGRTRHITSALGKAECF